MLDMQLLLRKSLTHTMYCTCTTVFLICSFSHSKQDMLEILKDYGKINITPAVVARVLGMMAQTHSDLADSLPYMVCFIFTAYSPPLLSLFLSLSLSLCRVLILILVGCR